MVNAQFGWQHKSGRAGIDSVDSSSRDGSGSGSAGGPSGGGSSGGARDGSAGGRRGSDTHARRAFTDQTSSANVANWARGHLDDDLAEAAVYVISVAADLAGMHPQTLRQYDRLGLVTPSRTSGRGRRYSRRDVEMLREIQKLSQEDGINLAGISRILELENEVDRLSSEVARLQAILGAIQERQNRVWAADSSGVAQAFRRGNRPQYDDDSRAVVIRRSGPVVVWDPRRS